MKIFDLKFPDLKKAKEENIYINALLTERQDLIQELKNKNYEIVLENGGLKERISIYEEIMKKDAEEIKRLTEERI